VLACNQGHSNEVISGHCYDDVTNMVASMEEQKHSSSGG